MGAFLLSWLIPRYKIALGIALTPIKRFTAFGFALDERRPTLGARNVNLFNNRLCVAAFREIRTCKELAEAPHLINHHRAAFFALHIGYLIRNNDLFNGCRRFLHAVLKRAVKFTDNLRPLLLAILDEIELAFHIRCELYVHNVFKVVLHQLRHNKTELRGNKLLFFASHVTALKDGGNRGGIGAGPADAAFFQRLHERSLRVTRRRLRKFLFFVKFLCGEHLADGKLGKRYVLFLRLVFPLRVNGGIAVKNGAHTVCAERASARIKGHGIGFKHGGRHLACKETFINQLVKLKLLVGQRCLHRLRRERNVCRADGLVRILRPLAAFEHVGLCRDIFFAVLRFYFSKRLLLRLVRNAHGVGTHVGNKAGRALSLQIDSFIKLLRHKHGQFRGKPKLARGLLLHAARGKRRGRAAYLFSNFAIRYGKVAFGGTADHLVRIGFVMQLRLFAAETVKFRFDGFARPFVLERCGNRPIFFADEIHDLLLAVAEDARGNGLNSARRKPLAYLCPKDRADLVPNQPVKHAARLLCIHKIHVDRTRGLHGLFYRAGCDFIEHDAALGVCVKLQNLRKVPGDCFSFHIRVGCKVDGLCVLCFLADAFQHIAPAAQRDVFGCKIMLDVHAELAFGQIAHMAVGRDDFIAVP